MYWPGRSSGRNIKAQRQINKEIKNFKKGKSPPGVAKWLKVDLKIRRS